MFANLLCWTFGWTHIIVNDSMLSFAKEFGVTEKVYRCKKHGLLHDEIRKANNRCKICHRESANRKRDNNRKWFNEKMAADRLANPEKWDGIYKRNYENNKAKYGDERVIKEIIRLKGLTKEQYNDLFISQNNRCAICKHEETRKASGSDKITRLCVDHCHKTGIVRALLCHACNTGLGKFKDNIDLLESAIKYLKKHGRYNGR